MACQTLWIATNKQIPDTSLSIASTRSFYEIYSAWAEQEVRETFDGLIQFPQELSSLESSVEIS